MFNKKFNLFNSFRKLQILVRIRKSYKLLIIVNQFVDNN